MTYPSDTTSADMNPLDLGAPDALGDLSGVGGTKYGPTVQVRSSTALGHPAFENMGVGDSFEIESDGVVIARLIGVDDEKGRFALRLEAVDTRCGGWRTASEVVRRGQWVQRDQATGLFSPVVDGIAVAQLGFATEQEAQAALTALRAVGHI